MIRLRVALVVAMLASLLISGKVLSADSSYEAALSNPGAQSVISYLLWCIGDARKVLETQVDLSQDYKQQVALLAGKLGEIENKLEEMKKVSSVSSSRIDSSPVDLSEALDNETRVSLLGVRALTEFKARQLNYQLENLTNGVKDKQAAFENTVQKAEALAEMVTKIKKILEPRMQRGDIICVTEIAQTNPLNAKTRERSTQLTQRTSTKTEPPLIFMQAMADASKLKPTNQLVGEKAAGVNSEAESAADELKRKMYEVTKEAKALQQLVSEIIQKAESIKKQEKNTDSKLSDMRQLKKTWEMKKIPDNKEIEAVENKLSGDMVIYEATLKEVDKLKQFLTSMFNGIFRTEQGTNN